RLKPAEQNEQRQLWAEIVNLKNMPRKEVLSCKSIDGLMQLFSSANHLPFPSSTLKSSHEN
ncbi:MAG: hypothetical protein ACLGGW_03130, partial [Gammaproteobacteria bacterium]